MFFNDLIQSNKIIILDGAMGTMLQKSGLKTGEIPELYSVTHPEIITDIHRQYIRAGANIIYTNTFGANSYKIQNCSSSVKGIIEASVQNAINARKAEDSDTLIALDVGPIGKLIEPSGSMTFEQAYDYFKEIVTASDEYDIVVFETMSDLYELKAGILAVKENTNKPVICTMSFESNGRTFTGCLPFAMAVTLSSLGVDAIGINCSLGPDEMENLIAEISQTTDLPIIIKPNAGMPNPADGTYNIDETHFADAIERLLPYGIKFVGGCCGTTPDYIAKISDRFKNTEYTTRTVKPTPKLCSASRSIVLDKPYMIGERINPTGKKLLKQALKDRNIDYILKQAIEQTDAGAEILDINVGSPEVDEVELMPIVIKAVQSVTDAVLQIDTSNPFAMEAGLRVCNGKVIVNSVNGESDVLATILPIVKKYGASVVGLTLDKRGIPKTADERFEIAKKIVNTAKAYGIPKEDVYIDCLTLTVSAEPEGAIQTLIALHRVKTELGCHTVLGVSNISFGLPEREIINSTFLTMALEQGLDLPIMNPNNSAMRNAFLAFSVLKNYDIGAKNYISAFSQVKQETASIITPNTDNDTLANAVEKGLKTKAVKLTEELLKTISPMEIIDSQLIPALDKAGDDFEKGITFLPQLIQSATAAQSAFEIIKQNISKSNSDNIEKGKIIIATVKGDIHDIGKNIVKVLLENYGFTVYDLGKDVEPAEVVNCAIKNNIKLIGLSALMTTTLKSMEDTIKLVHNTPELQNADGSSKCTFFVGGAVLTEDYSQKIGADYYCRDAKASVDVAKKFFGT